MSFYQPLKDAWSADVYGELSLRLLEGLEEIGEFKDDDHESRENRLSKADWKLREVIEKQFLLHGDMYRR